MQKLAGSVLIFVVLLMLYSDVDARRSKKTYMVEIDERGTQFNESVEIDQKEKIVVYKVPAHNDVDKSEILFDYKTGYFVTRIPKVKECYIQPIPKVQSSSGQVRKNLQLYEKFNGNKSALPVKTIRAVVVKERRISQTELSSRFLVFCGDYEAYQVKQIYQDEAFSTKGNETKRGVLQKRSTPFLVGNEKTIGANQAILMSIDVWIRGKKRSVGWQELTLNTCEKLKFYMPELKRGGCDKKPDDWEYHCGGKTANCMYYVKCKLESGQIRCEEWHFFTGHVCCTVKCST